MVNRMKEKLEKYKGLYIAILLITLIIMEIQFSINSQDSDSIFVFLWGFVFFFTGIACVLNEGDLVTIIILFTHCIPGLIAMIYFPVSSVEPILEDAPNNLLIYFIVAIIVLILAIILTIINICIKKLKYKRGQKVEEGM